jgi:type 1 fimbriae regulatory protein FimB/type 1 fimbriae regulatory protein FimE
MPASVKRTVPKLATGDRVAVHRCPPGRKSNAEHGRVREYLTPAELALLITTAKRRGRYGLRDALAIRMAFRHGLRVSELCGLTWDRIDFTTARISIERLKGSRDATHPIDGDELRELRKLQRLQEAGSRFLFVTERGAPMTPDGFRRMLQRVGAECGLPQIHPHMLRHSCGFALADKRRDLREIQDYLGHSNLNHTVRYTELAPGRFDAIWS